MNSVAVSKITAMMSQSASVSAVSKDSKGNDFGAVFNKAKDIQSHPQDGQKTIKDVKAEKTDKAEKPEKPEKPVQDAMTPEEDTAVSDQEVKVSDQKGSKEETNHADEIKDEVIQKIAKSLGITEEKLNEMMASLNLTFVDLFSNKGLQTLMNAYFDMNNEVDILKNPNAFDVFKEIKETLTDVLKQFNMSKEDLRRQVETLNMTQASQAPMNVQTTTIPVVASQQVTSTNNITEADSGSGTSSGYTVEVVDNREVKDQQQTALPVEDVAKEEGKNKNDRNEKDSSSFQDRFEQMFQQKVTHKVEVVSGNGVKEMVYQTINAKDVLGQVINQVKVSLTDIDTTMTFQLKPENLGKVAFSVTSQNGVLTGHIVAENNAVKDTIEANLANLKVNLQEQGIKLDEVKVVVGNTNQFFDQSAQSKNSNHFSRDKRRRFSKDDDGIEAIGQKVVDLETIANQYLTEKESSVDFSA